MNGTWEKSSPCGIIPHIAAHRECSCLPPNTHTKCQHCINKMAPQMSKLAPKQHCPIEIHCLRGICSPASSPPDRSQPLLDSSLLLPSLIFSFPFLPVQPLHLTPGPAEASSWSPCFWPLPSILARELCPVLTQHKDISLSPLQLSPLLSESAPHCSASSPTNFT